MTLLILIQENQILFAHTERIKKQCMRILYQMLMNHIKEGKAIVNSSNATLEEIKKSTG